MNIIVKTFSGHCLVRPDTSWERKSDDFYLPDGAGPLLYSPVVYAHISKPGKSVAFRFAGRYYDSISYGMLLYPQGLLDGTPEGYAASICLDHISLLPYPLQQAFPAPGAEFKLSVDGRELFKCCYDGRYEIEKAIADATARILVRAGDLIAVELKEKEILCQGPAHINAVLGDATLMDFRII
ncbi:MAG: hypothetical protein K5850_03905 [Bacteroidales bacterium]|jgi:hypothetical protein|nr:hypothetical protein [Bacteroidales bacterium]